MSPELKKHYPLIHEELVKAQDIIKQKTGLSLKLLVRRVDTKIEDIILFEFTEFFRIWGVNLLTVSTKNREYPYPEYRWVLWLYCRRKYPKVSLRFIGSILGNSDHTTVIYGVNAALDMLETQDEKFLKVYNPVKHLMYNELDETI